MDTKIIELEERISKLDSIKLLSKRLNKSSDIKNDIGKLEKELNNLSIRLDNLHNNNGNNKNLSSESESNESESNESEQKIDIKMITARISETKNKIDGDADITARVELYYRMKTDIEQCKKYYRDVKMTVKNLN